MMHVLDIDAAQGESARQYARIGAAVFVDMASIISDSFDHDISIGVTLLAIIRATRARRMDTWQASDPAPASEQKMRDPVTARTLAEIVQLPFETVRNHVRKLRRAGYCTTSQEGVLLANDFHAGKKGAWLVDRAARVAEALMNGPARTLASADERRWTSNGVQYQVARLLSRFLVDSLQSARRNLGVSPVELVVLRSLWVANVEHISRDPALSQRFGDLHDIPGDDVRRPVTAYALAKRLSMPYETVRRTITRLIRSGWVERTPAGTYLLPARISETPEMLAVVSDCARLTKELISRLSETQAYSSASIT